MSETSEQNLLKVETQADMMLLCWFKVLLMELMELLCEHYEQI